MWENTCRYLLLIGKQNSPIVNIPRVGFAKALLSTKDISDLTIRSFESHSYGTGISAVQLLQHFDGLMQERRNSIANALELRLSCTNPSNGGYGVPPPEVLLVYVVWAWASDTLTCI